MEIVDDNSNATKNPELIIPTNETEIIKKSEMPNKGQEKLIQKIIQQTQGFDKDMNNLEKQLLGEKVEEGKQEWNDVDSNDVMDAEISFSVDPNLSNDPDLPGNCPKLDSNLNTKTEVSDYNNLNFENSNRIPGDSASSTKIKKERSGKLLSGIIRKYHKSPKNVQDSESFIDLNYNSKLNCTMPKLQTSLWMDSRKIILERNNSTIKIKDKPKDAVITPKRVEMKGEDYSNYSQAPTPLPDYRSRSKVNKQIKLDDKPKKNAQDSFRLAKKAINKSAITVKEDQAYSSASSVQTDFKNLKYYF